MKIRQGFVSNSSTTSFCIYGIAFETDVLAAEMLDKFNISEDEFNDKYYGSLYELMEKEMDDIDGFEWHEPDYSDTFYIGRSWALVRNNETGAEFKAKIEKILKEKFGDDIEFSTLEEAWRDG